MAEMISMYETVAGDGHGVGPAARYSYKIDAPLAEFAWEPRENRLVQRVAEARALGVSYGHYMAMLKDGAVEDPLATTPAERKKRKEVKK